MEKYNMVYSYMKESAPTPKTYFVDVPFSDGVHDMTEFNKTIPFNNVDCMISFGITKNFDAEKHKNRFVGDFVGKKVDMQIESEGHIRRGRIISVDFEESVSHLGINCLITREPYRLKKDVTSVKLTIDGTKMVQLENEQKRAEVKLVTSGTVTVRNGFLSYVFNQGTHILPFVLLPGDNPIEVTGTNAEVEFIYQEGVL